MEWGAYRGEEEEEEKMGKVVRVGIGAESLTLRRILCEFVYVWVWVCLCASEEKEDEARKTEFVGCAQRRERKKSANGN